MSAIAYFITIHTYGTRLRGDDRGWVDYRDNRFGTPLAAPDPALAATHAARMKDPPVTFDRTARTMVNQALIDVCEHLHLRLHTKNVRTEHAHIVLASRPEGTGHTRSPIDPFLLRGKLKSRSTRLLADAGCYERGSHIWAEHGSVRHLFTPEDIEIAVRYVRDGQGSDLDS